MGEKPDDNGNKIPDEAERMTPNQTIIKDPQVKNTGNNDAFIYMTVEVPCRQIISVNNDGTRNPLAMRELYNYQVDNSWKLLGTVDVSDESGKKVAVKTSVCVCRGTGNLYRSKTTGDNKTTV